MRSESLDQSLILEAHSLELSASISLVLNGGLGVFLILEAFLLRLFEIVNLFSIFFMDFIDFLNMVFWLIFKVL